MGVTRLLALLPDVGSLVEALVGQRALQLGVQLQLEEAQHHLLGDEQAALGGDGGVARVLLRLRRRLPPEEGARGRGAGVPAGCSRAGRGSRIGSRQRRPVLCRGEQSPVCRAHPVLDLAMAHAPPGSPLARLLPANALWAAFLKLVARCGPVRICARGVELPVPTVGTLAAGAHAARLLLAMLRLWSSRSGPAAEEGASHRLSTLSGPLATAKHLAVLQRRLVQSRVARWGGWRPCMWPRWT